MKTLLQLLWLIPVYHMPLKEINLCSPSAAFWCWLFDILIPHIQSIQDLGRGRAYAKDLFLKNCYPSKGALYNGLKNHFPSLLADL